MLDIGCGPGTYVRELRIAGVEATGIDTDDRVLGQQHLRQQSLFELQQQAHLVICLEVAEHIEPAKAQDVASSVVQAVEAGGWLIWSAAHPGQGGVGHINCQLKDYWAQLITAAGLQRDAETEQQMLAHIEAAYHMGWFRQNAMVFKR